MPEKWEVVVQISLDNVRKLRACAGQLLHAEAQNWCREHLQMCFILERGEWIVSGRTLTACGELCAAHGHFSHLMSSLPF